MKAIVKTKPGKGLEMIDVKKPIVGEYEILIKPKKVAICGTDLNIYNWEPWAERNVPTPLVIGHEFMGHVAEVGKLVKGFKVGDRVSGEGHLVCGTCRHCRTGSSHLCPHTRGIGYHVPGCFSDYFVLPATNVVPLPDSIPDEIGAILDPLGNTIHAALSFDLVGKDVLIAGAGPIGLMAISVAKKAGARFVVITDKNDYRIKLAKKMGAYLAINVSKEPFPSSIGFSIGLEMSGSIHGLNFLLENLIPGGNISLLGILPSGGAIDWNLVIFKMLTLQGIYGRKMYQTWYTMLDLLESGLDIRSVITHQFPAKDFEKGFQAMLKKESGKVILNWD